VVAELRRVSQVCRTYGASLGPWLKPILLGVVFSAAPEGAAPPTESRGLLPMRGFCPKKRWWGRPGLLVFFFV